MALYRLKRKRIGSFSAAKSIFIVFASFFFLQGEIRHSTQTGNVQINSLRGQARSLMREGNYEQSIEYFKKCLNLLSSENQDRLECYMNLGILLWNIDNMEESADYFSRAHKLAAGLNLQKERRECEAFLKIHGLFLQATEFRNKGNVQSSNQCFQEAMALATAIKSFAHELKILRTWSVNYLSSADRGKYLELNRQALPIAQRLNHKMEILKVFGNIGSYYSAKNDYSHALSNYFKALDAAIELDSKKEMTKCLCNIAIIFISLGDYEKSYEYLSEALKNSKDVPSSNLSFIFNNLGVSFQKKASLTGDVHDYLRAIECFRARLDLTQKGSDESSRTYALNNIGNVYIDLRQYEKALSCLQPSYEMAQRRNDPLLMGTLLHSVGMVHLRQKDFSKAEKLFDRALKNAQKAGDDALMMKSHYGLALCQERRGEYGQALFHYHQSIKIIDAIGSRIRDDTSRAGFIRNKMDIYETLINLYYELFDKRKSIIFAHEIFNTAEKAKARSFVELLERLGKWAGARVPGESEEEEKFKNSRLDYLRRLATESLEIEKKKDMEVKIRQAEDRLMAGVFDKFLEETQDIPPEPVTIEALQKYVLDDETALMEYILGENRSFVIMISNDSFHVVPLPTNDRIQDSLIAYLEFLKDAKISQRKGIAAAERLYDELFRPVEGWIPVSVTKLIIVPDGILYSLPFETLLPNNGNSLKKDFLIKRWAISYAPSASALAYLTRTNKKREFSKDLLAFGAPDYPKSSFLERDKSPSPAKIMFELYKENGFSFSPIDYSKKEVGDISKHFRTGKKDVFLGEKAEEGIFKALNLNDYRIIHFACHAFSDENFPLRSALVLSLSTESEEDGFLQVLEMYDVRLRSDLVVLSACQTGRGKNIRGEGILGLPRIFFYMGSRSVVSTLWAIDDKATAQFMKYFYSYFSESGDKTQALRLAKLKMIDSKYSHPFYWGAFVLTGEY